MNHELSLLRVVKVGGSLLDWPQLPAALEEWLAARPIALNVLICGCGKFGDRIRRADQDFSLGEEVSHWLCIDLLSTTARLLSAILPAADPITQFEQLQKIAALKKTSVVVFDPREFMRAHEPTLPGHVLPKNWSVTTDSIAARLAEVLTADELVLLKSTDAPHASLTELARTGHVDPHFPTAASLIKAVRIENLRNRLLLNLDP